MFFLKYFQSHLISWKPKYYTNEINVKHVDIFLLLVFDMWSRLIIQLVVYYLPLSDCSSTRSG